MSRTGCLLIPQNKSLGKNKIRNHSLEITTAHRDAV
jgi:hypothetical protein